MSSWADDADEDQSPDFSAAPPVKSGWGKVEVVQPVGLTFEDFEVNAVQPPRPCPAAGRAAAAPEPPGVASSRPRRGVAWPLRPARNGAAWRGPHASVRGAVPHAFGASMRSRNLCR